MLDDVQAAPIDKLPVDERWITVPAEVGDVHVRIVRPPDADGHAAGDPLHARRRLGARQRGHARPARPRARRRRRRRASSFVEYDRSPEAHYPVAIEQGYATAQWIVREGAAHGLDPERHGRRRRLGRRRHDRGARAHGAASAATSASCSSRCTTRSPTPRMDTGSYEQFAEGYFLTAKAMAWFWDAYLPGPRAALGAVRLTAARERRAARRPSAGVR